MPALSSLYLVGESFRHTIHYIIVRIFIQLDCYKFSLKQNCRKFKTHI
jgi:hypothetical protein